MEGVTIEGPNAGVTGDSDERGDEANVSLSSSIDFDEVTVDGVRIIPNSQDGVNTKINGTNTTVTNSVVVVPSSGAPFRLQSGSDGTVISQSLFAGNPNSSDGGNFVINARQDFSKTIDSVEISENTFRDALGSGTTAIQAAGLTNADINGNTFENIGEDAIRLAADLDGTEIRNNEFNNTAQNPTFPAGAIVANNVAASSTVDISNNLFGSGDETFVAAYDRAETPALDLENILTDQGNTFEPNAVEFAGNSLVAETAVNVVNVDQRTGFDEIQTAVNNANTSETIEVSAGVYNESVEIDVDGLTVEGPNADLAGNSSERDEEAVVASSTGDEGQISVLADNVTLDGLEIGGADTQYGLVPYGNDLRVEDSVFNADGQGIWAANWQYNKFPDNTPPEDIEVARSQFNGQSVGVGGIEGDTDVFFTGNGFNGTATAVAFGNGTVEFDALGNLVKVNANSSVLPFSAYYEQIGQAVGNADSNGVVEISPGTYAENVTVDTANVTLVGQGDNTVIDGSVALEAGQTELSHLRVNASIGDVFPNPADGNNAINVVGDGVAVRNVSVDVGISATDPWQEPIGIEVSGSSTTAVIENSSVTGTAEFSDDRVGIAGVSTRAGAESTVRNNDINVTSDGYSFAVVTRGEETETVTQFNELSAVGNGEGLNGVGFGVEDNASAVDQTVQFNTFDGVDAIEHKSDTGTLDVTGNYWADLGEVEFLTDGFNHPYQNGGNVTYDPFLTVEPSELNAGSLTETTQFGHDLVVPADGTPHSVAFPAPVDGTVTEVFGEFNGTVYAYDGDGWESGEAIADRNVGALDAFTVKVDEGEDDLRIAFEYADSDAQFPTSTDLETGWNFVGAPESGTSADAFDVTTTNIQTVSHINAGAGSQPYDVTSTPPFAANPDSVSPFQGYWVFVSEDGELGATVPVGPTQSNEEGALAGN